MPTSEDGKQHESGECESDGELLVSREQARVATHAQECEHADARGADGLH